MTELAGNEKWLIALVIGILIVITILTRFYGGADVYDYADVAKFFAGKYDAKIRTSHSYLYGLIHAPFLKLMDNFFIFKITSLLSLLLIVYSVYWMSGKDKRALWLMLLSPIVWYMAPWSSPIQLSSLLFLWGFYFLRKYDNSKETKKSILYLFYSGILVGLSWAFWDAVLFFAPLLIISFFYNKKLLHVIYYLIFILIGVLPRLILDQYLFGFAFFTIIRHVFASLALTFLGGFYGQGGLWGFWNLILVIIFLPVSTYLIFYKKIFKENNKAGVFIFLSILLLILNSQIRFVLLIAPIIIISVIKYLDKKKYIIQIMVSLVLILLVLNPYVLQIKWNIGENEKGIEFESFVRNIRNISLDERFARSVIEDDIYQIVSEYPDEIFVVGNGSDDYRVLANIYFGENVKEFVSVEDYRLNLSGENIVARKELCTNVKINERRDFCFSALIRKAFNDETNYSEIKYGISFEDNLELEGFELVKKYERLSVFEKIN